MQTNDYHFTVQCKLGVYSHIFGMVDRVFVSGPGDRSSNLGQIMPKSFKMVLDATLLNTQHYKAQIKGKWINAGKGVASSPTPRYSSY